MRSFLLICLVFLCFNTFTSGYISLRDSGSSTDPLGYGNDFEHDFALDVYDIDNSSRVLLPSSGNDSTVSVGELFFTCVNGSGYAVGDSSIPINIRLRIQRKYKIADVYIWVGVQGTSPSITDYTQWVDGSSNAGGVTFVNTSLTNHSTFHRLIHLGDLASILSANNGSTCFTVLVYVSARAFCGFSHTPRNLGISPSGCDVSYQAIYPSAQSYFTVAVNSGAGEYLLNNGTTYYKGYCLTPARGVNPNSGYTGRYFSSYDPAVLGSTDDEFFENPSGLPIVNYIINHESEYQSTFLSGYQCTWQDIQYVIWDVLNPSAATTDPYFYILLTNTTSECRQFIYSDAVAKGQNYTPSCPGGKYLMILYPQLPGSSGDTCNEDNSTQIVAFPYGGSCLNRCQPKTCTDVLRAQGSLCLSGKCGIRSSPVPTISSLPTVPSTSESASQSRHPVSASRTHSKSRYPSGSNSRSHLPAVHSPSNSPCNMGQPSHSPSNSPCNMGQPLPSPSNSPCDMPGMGGTSGGMGGGNTK